MASPPTKRQRRSTIILSDDDEEPSDQARLSVRTSSKTNARKQNITQTTQGAQSPQAKRSTSRKKVQQLKASPKSSPEKSKSVKGIKDFGTNKSLHSFFSKAPEEQRWQKKSQSPEHIIDGGEFDDAIIDDDSLDEGFAELAGGKDETQKGPEVLKPQALVALSGGQRLLPTPTQRFVKPAPPVKQGSPSTQPVSHTAEADYRPWSDKYGPKSLDELAVHKKKVSDVQRWLSDVLAGRDQRVCYPYLLRTNWTDIWFSVS